MAVMFCGTECDSCIRNVKMIVQGFVVVLLIVGLPETVFAGPVKGCELARNEIINAGFPDKAVLERPNENAICGADSCCTPALEQQMLHMSKSQLDAFLRDSITKLSALLETRAKRFDNMFRDMMETSKREFHNMFQRTYGKIYLQNMYVFSDFFSELETYYKKGTTRLSDTLEKFFGILYQKMFKVINAKYVLDDAYLDCVAEQMIAMKPFGDVPAKLSLQLRRSFVATRTYYRSLAAAAEAARALSTLRMDAGCEKEMARMQMCGRCLGARGDGTCNNYCEAVLLQCLAQHVAFSEEWDLFVEALDKVADRLIGPYNIEMVVEPLNIKISEAVMNFQESGAEITEKIFKICGTPELEARVRRQVEEDPSIEIDKPRKERPAKRKKPKKTEVEDASEASALEKLLKDIKSRVKETRQFWKQLPYQYCNNATIVASPESTQCWNGAPSVDSPRTTRPSITPAIVNTQIYQLGEYRDRLKKAFDGNEVELSDDSEDFDGSGSGSGDFEITEPEEEQPDDRILHKEVEEENIDNEVVVVKNEEPEIRKEYGGGAASISLCKALAHYLIPIVLVWFGGAISDLL